LEPLGPGEHARVAGSKAVEGDDERHLAPLALEEDGQLESRQRAEAEASQDERPFWPLARHFFQVDLCHLLDGAPGAGGLALEAHGLQRIERLILREQAAE